MAQIALVGKFSTTQYTYASSFEHTLKTLGHHVTAISYAAANNFIPYKIQKIIINKKVIQAITKQQPDIIFFIKAETITAKTIAFLKKNTSATIINFYPDNPFSFWNGNANKELLLSLPLYDHFLIWSHMLAPALTSAGAQNVYYFPFAYDEELFASPLILSHQDHKQFDSDISFVGTWDTEREYWLQQLIERQPQLNFALWGNKWEEHLLPESPLRNYLRGKAIYSHDMRKALQCSKITLNFIRKQNMTSHNMRTFEALANKTFMLTQRTIEQTTAPFEEGTNIECFENIEELSKKIDFYLNNDTIRNSIASRGNTIAHKFTLRKQLQILLKDVGHDRKE